MYVFLYLLVQIVVKNRPEIKNLQVLAIGQIWVYHVARVLGEETGGGSHGGDGDSVE